MTAEVTEEGGLIPLTIHSTAKDTVINERSGPRTLCRVRNYRRIWCFKGCWAIFGCNAEVSIGISGKGQNAEVSMTPNSNFFNRKYIYGGSCKNGR